MAAEMARSPAAPGLLFTTASVRGFSLASEVVSKLVDRTSLRAQQVGAEVTQKLQQACENVAVQTEVSQGAFQEWKGLMTGILSEEASKIQAELDHASRTVSSWQLQQSAESHAQSQSKSDQHTDLKAHPLSLPQFEMPQLESGWLVEAVQQCFPNIGAPSAWPTSFSVAASSDSMSVSDDEESRTPSSPTSLATQLMTQARHYTNQVAKSPTGETATLHSRDTHAASSGNGLRSIFMTKARQLTGQRFDVSPFSPVSSAERSTFKLGQGGKSSDKKVLQPEQLTSESIELRPSPLDALPAPLHLADTSSQTPQLTGKQPDQNTGKTAAKSVRIIRPEPTPNWRTPRPLTPPPTPVQQGHPLSAIPAAVELDSTVAGGSSAAESVAERPDKALNVDMNGQRENEPLRSQTNTIGSATPSRLAGTDARHVAVSSDSVLGSNSPNRVAEGDATSYGNGRQPTTTAATAAVSDSATIVIDSIPWGPSGAATAEGRTAPTQSSGGGGSTTGGSTGGGGGRSDKPSGGTVGSVFLLSSRVRQALQTAVASVKAQFTSGEEQHAVVDELESESADEPEGIETNIVVKEGDTAWSIAEEYTGSGTSWPEVVASNSNVDTAKPVAGTTLRVRVRM
ncbi:hypothetical protein WJX79_010443 [Trebouxia sp. C0005]